MIIHEGLENLTLNHPVVTIGIFDGVHRGHQALLNSVISLAGETGGESVAVTFNPHPRLVLNSNLEGISFLSTSEEKKKLLEKTRLDHLIIIRFDDYIRNLSACEFIRIVLVEKIGIRHLLVGYDHHFGKGREGDFNIISQCASKYGFMVQRVNEVSENDVIISSTSIREALLAGRIEDANRWLGYSYSLNGIVIPGRKIGRNLGFPTANIKPADKYKLTPADGVYAVEIELDGKLYKGMLSIGINPTVNNDSAQRSVEVHIFELDKDIYDRELRIVFRYRLRDEVRFDSLSKLATQMARDKQHALRLLEKHSN